VRSFPIDHFVVADRILIELDAEPREGGEGESRTFKLVGNREEISRGRLGQSVLVFEV
jgi:hypothetical protein